MFDLILFLKNMIVMAVLGSATDFLAHRAIIMLLYAFLTSKTHITPTFSSLSVTWPV